MFERLLALVLLTGCASVMEATRTEDDRCLSGNEPDVCHEIGVAALKGTIPNHTRARRFLSKACAFHHAESCSLLGGLVEGARGGPRDPERAVELFDIACRGDIKSACVQLGNMLFEGDGVPEDPARAVELFKASCVADPIDPSACSALGRAYAEGKGVPKVDVVIAERLQRKACEADLAEGCLHVGLLYRDRITGKPEPHQDDVAVAVEFLNRACRADPKAGCYELAQMHHEGEAPGASDAKAVVFFQTACKADPTRGCFEAAEIMESGSVKARTVEIEALYNQACEHGNTAACAKRDLPG